MGNRYHHGLAKRYDRNHQKKREALKAVVALGRTPCARCGELIGSREPWDLDHLGGVGGNSAPSHRRCNRGQPKKRAAYDPPPRPSTVW